MAETALRTYADRGISAPRRAGRRPAFIAVDLSYGFTEPNGPLGCDPVMVAGALAATRRLLDAARRASIPVVHTRIAYQPGDEATAAAFREKLPALATLTDGSHPAALDAAVAPIAGESVLRKLFASAFFGTALPSLLAARGCDSVVLAGATTCGCVRATAVDAMQYGYHVMVVRDAVADRAAAPHEASLFDIQTKYGDVVGLDAALGAIDEAGARREADG